MIKSKDRIKKLITILEDSNINSMEVSSFWGFLKIKLSKSSSNSNNTYKPDFPIDRDANTSPSPQNIADSLTSANIESSTTEESASADVSGHIQKAPLVGTVYLSPKPGEDNFICEGQKVTKGDTICIIEAMKIFNEIESEKTGTVKLIYVENESPVEFGQPIVEIIPD
tara:strand:- start:3097 stop:3603 length:507 start_codon:yes stop_codon:yes gene_type:complete